MTKTERVQKLIKSKNLGFVACDQKYLESLPDERLAALEAKDAETETRVASSAVTPEQIAAQVKEQVDAAIRAAEAARPQPKTAAEYVAAAPADMREALNAGLRALESEKSSLVKVIVDSKRSGFTEEQLKSKSTDELRTLITFAGLDVPATDYSNRGLPRPSETAPEQVAAAPDMNAQIRTARGVK